MQASDLSSEISERINELRSSSNQIRKIMGLITNISDQTNLSTFNTTIESDREGQNGFSIVNVTSDAPKLEKESETVVYSSNNLISEIIKKIENSVNLISLISDDIQKTIKFSTQKS